MFSSLKINKERKKILKENFPKKILQEFLFHFDKFFSNQKFSRKSLTGSLELQQTDRQVNNE